MFYLFDQVYDETGHVAKSWSFYQPCWYYCLLFYSCWFCCFLYSLYITISHYSFYVWILFLFYFSISFHHMLTRYMHVHLTLLFYTLIGSFSDDPRFAHPDLECFILLIRCSLKSYASRGAEVSFYSILVFLLFFYSGYFLDSLYIASSCYFFIISYDILCEHLYVVLQWYWFIILDFYNLFRLLYA